MKNVTATLINHPNGFSVSMPQVFFIYSKDEREDLMEHLKASHGTYDAANRKWDFPATEKVAIFNILKAFNIRLTIHNTMEKLKNNKFNMPAILPPKEIIVEAPPERKILVQVPKTIIGPQDPAVKRILETNFMRIKNEFLKLHMETGINKTKMRQLLSEAVPAVVQTTKEL